MPIIIRDIDRFIDIYPIWFRECTPKILVVTDGLNFSAADDFGLTRFVATLRGTPIHGMNPIVQTARYNPGAAVAASLDGTGHISNFQFTDAGLGLTKARYDVVFLMAYNREGAPGLADEPGAQAAITTFMQQGGGLFATGDHEDLGAAMCMQIPRVQAMRRWAAADTPQGGDSTRLSTNLAGANDVYEFDDQADALPQRLYVNFRTQAGGTGAAHPLLQTVGGPASRAIEVFPDHPHEGECLVPSALNTKLPDGVTDEWPAPAAGGARVQAEAVALTMSHGDSFPGKEALAPRAFIPICAYDGQLANVGRVVTDATWHHFVNINFLGLAGRDLADIQQYQTNLAHWLMPKHVRRCLRWPVLLRELLRFPLYEEIRPWPLPKFSGRALRELGAKVEQALLQRHAPGLVQAFLEDALADAVGEAGVRALRAYSRRFGEISARDAGLAALAGLTLATVQTANELGEHHDKPAIEAFEKAGLAMARQAAQRYLTDARDDLRTLDEVLGLAMR